MHYIIETKEQLAQLASQATLSKSYVEIINLSDLYHPVLTKPCLLYYNPVNSPRHKGYMICINHSESMNIDWEDVKKFIQSRTYGLHTTNVKNFAYFGIDTQYIKCVKNKFPDHYNTKTHDVFFKTKPYHIALNAIIPISKHYEKWESFYSELIKNAYVWYDTSTLPLIEIEKNGIGINKEIFDKYFEVNYPQHSIVGNKIYTYYNLNTTTGRPSNSFNGVNFAALPKGKAREAFVPLNDKFIEFDFDGYHVRLLATMSKCGIFTADESVHTTLGRLYFDKQELTEEEYNKSKQITFQQLYGGIRQEYISHPFFGAIQDLVNMSDLTHKELNYKIQQLETKRNLLKIAEINESLRLNNFKSKLVLYTYDSFLFDVDDYEEDKLIALVKHSLESGPRDTESYPVKIKHGTNYGALIKY